MTLQNAPDAVVHCAQLAESNVSRLFARALRVFRWQRQQTTENGTTEYEKRLRLYRCSCSPRTGSLAWELAICVQPRFKKLVREESRFLAPFPSPALKSPLQQWPLWIFPVICVSPKHWGGKLIHNIWLEDTCRKAFLVYAANRYFVSWKWKYFSCHWIFWISNGINWLFGETHVFDWLLLESGSRREMFFGTRFVAAKSKFS